VRGEVVVVLHIVLEFIGLFLIGLGAGEEVTVRYGVRGPLATLDDRSHIRLRQELIRTLRVLVPATFLPAFGIGIAVAILDGRADGFAFRWAGVTAMLVWMVATFFGTVPINAAAMAWSPDTPPGNWKALVDRWERLNTVRTWAAVCAFACFLVAAAVRLYGN
jgi:uncharacterized membrane protein